MKLINKSIDKDGKGSVTLIPEDSEDMWHSYNLIQVGDSLKASTIRKVTLESATGTTGSNRVRTTLTIAIEQIEYDSQACLLRVRGRNIVENQYVKMGQYHTLDLELNRKFTLFKNMWDSIALDRLETACDPSQTADLVAVIMQQGLAHLCLVTSSMTILKAKIDVAIPRKRKGNNSQHEKGLHKFYDNIIQAIIRHVNFDVVKCVLLASPGFVKDDFFQYLCQQAIKQDIKVLIENKGKFVLSHSSSGFKHSLKEVLTDPLIQSKLIETKAAAEVRALDAFYAMLQNEPNRAYYGIKHVEKANELQAIETLLISDTLFRCEDVQQRKRFVKLVDDVKESGGEVRIFSSLHVSGEQLDQLSGIAAILRFPVPEPEDEDSSDDES
ncbi:Protein pelota-like protein [Dinothrombium tinctorium]|uniref:Protein pelota homolog n=1 Tax=Dinothrombium tinctorium TaxID=1965070 RepID=A0A3S3NW70_9ACAR|nr:Protein pelota-like protein [Dinothrombium tinctorium]